MSSATATSSRRAAHARCPRRRRSPITGFIGFIGELLLTAGLVLGLFVVWQLFWTDVEAHREQAQALEHLRESITVPADGPTADGPRTDAPPAMDAPAEGADFGALYVPRWGERAGQVPIAEGVGRHDVLDRGRAGHFPQTAMPGEVGNFALAAHRQTYGAAFHQIDRLEEGDRLIVQTGQAWLVYEVTGSEIILPEETDILAPVPGEPGVEATDRLITLITCHPLWSTAERYVVHGEFVEWYPPSQDMPDELTEGN